MKIGFIDYYLDEWHANNYPEFFRQATDGKMQVCYAYGMIDSKTGITNKEWAEKYNVELLDSIEEVVEKSDYIVVLSPDNPEMHLTLSDIPLKSGKPVYIDKTFAFKLSEAKQIFENADKHNTPCYSSSALYFADELKDVEKENISRITSVGTNKYEIYGVHQIEQIVYLMGYDAKRVMFLGDCTQESFLIEFEGNRFAEINFYIGQKFGMTIGYNDGVSKNIEINSPFFDNCIKGMTEFFETKIIPVPHEQTLAVAGIIETGFKAKEKPFEWIEIN